MGHRRQTPVPDGEALIYADSQSGRPEKKKQPGRSRRILLALGAAVVLLMAAAVLWMWRMERQVRYDGAQALLAGKHYEAAAAEFAALGNYRDSRDRAAQLAQQQAAYEAAVALLEQQRYSEAITAFRALGDYADSAGQAAYFVTYRMALDLINEIDVGKTRLLMRLLPDQVRLTDENSYPVTVGYEAAAALLESLGDYESAPALIDRCYYSAGLVKLGWEDWQGALAYMEKMSDETAAEFYEDYLQRYHDYTEKEGR